MLRDALRSTVGDAGFIAAADYEGDGRLACADADAWLAAYRAHVGDPDAPDPCGLMDPTDSDGDGVPDLCDFCPGTVTGALVDAYGCPPVIPGDMDGDGDVDMTDFGIFQTCLTGPQVLLTNPACEPADLNRDRRVDYRDMVILLGCASGADIFAEPCCGSTCD